MLCYSHWGLGLLFCCHCEPCCYFTPIGMQVCYFALIECRSVILLLLGLFFYNYLLLWCFVLLFNSDWGFGFVILLSLCVVLLFYSHWGLGLLFCYHCESFCYVTLIGVHNFCSALIVFCCVILLFLGLGLLFCSNCVPIYYLSPIRVWVCYFALIVCRFVILLPLGAGLLFRSQCVSFCNFTPIGV